MQISSVRARHVVAKRLCKLDVHVLRLLAHVAGLPVEACRVEFVRLSEVSHTKSKVSQLVDGRRPWS